MKASERELKNFKVKLNSYWCFFVGAACRTENMFDCVILVVGVYYVLVPNITTITIINRKKFYTYAKCKMYDGTFMNVLKMLNNKRDRAIIYVYICKNLS